MHALGNNYIYVDLWETPLVESELVPLAVAVSDVRKGIGSDGLIVYGPSAIADVKMRIFNADGSEAETCGNGLRCVARLVYEQGHVRQKAFRIEAKSGVVEAFVETGSDGSVDLITIDMGMPVFGATATDYVGPVDEGNMSLIAFGADVWRGHLVSMGNPHVVHVVDDVGEVDLSSVGPLIERHPYFPKRVNVEFMAPRGRRELDFRVWERGSGVTFACGTGACASVAAGIRAGLLDDDVLVHLQGGDLRIRQRNGHIWMTGEAVVVLRGEYLWGGSSRA